MNDYEQRQEARTIDTFWTDTDLISSYTRAQAIEDGTLIDVTDTAKQLFKIPVAITAAVWNDINAIPARLQGIQDPIGRLWDILWMGQFAAKGAPDQETITYRLIMHIGRYTYYTVKMVIGGGDAGEPVMTFMRPDES